MKNISLCQPLKRRGSKLYGQGKVWQMLRISAVEDDLSIYPAELWRVETSNGDSLILFRSKHDFGMRSPQLLRIERDYLPLAL